MQRIALEKYAGFVNGENTIKDVQNALLNSAKRHYQAAHPEK